MTEERQGTALAVVGAAGEAVVKGVAVTGGTNQISTKRGFPVYRTNPSVPSTSGITTRTKRFQVPAKKFLQA